MGRPRSAIGLSIYCLLPFSMKKRATDGRPERCGVFRENGVVSIAMRVTDGRPYKQGEQRLCGRYLIDPLFTQQRDDRLRQLRQTFIFGLRNRLFA